MSTQSGGNSSPMSRGSSLEIALRSLGSDPTKNPVFILDGGTGEELFRRGVPDDRKIWSATAVVHEKYHEILEKVHLSFLEAGSDAITTNSYGLVPGVGFEADEISKHCETAGRIARQAASKHSPKSYVLGSLGPLVESYRPDLIIDHEKGVLFYKRMVSALRPWVDAFLAETLSSVEESMQVLDAMSQSAQDKSILISYTLNSDGKLRSDETPETAIPRILTYARERKVEVPAVLFNCCEPEAISLALERLEKSPSAQDALDNCLLGAYANRLTPVPPGWTMEESDGPQPFRKDLDPDEYFREFAETWCVDKNVRLIGGCCGITPEHIQILNDRLRPKKTE